MENEVTRLAYVRSIVAKREASLAEAEAELHVSPLWLRLENRKESLATVKTVQATVEIEVRKQALDIYEETGDKAPHPAVKIKIYTVLEYKDEDAVNYAREHLPQALKLDRRVFTRAAKAVAMDFVAILQEPRTTIARDLSEYLSKD